VAVRFGCNYQFAPNWVIGIEGDGEATGIKGDVTESVSFTDPRTGGPNTVTGTAHAQTDWIASVTGRVGWTWDRVMLYAKGGAAWAGDKYSADLPAFNEHIATRARTVQWGVGRVPTTTISAGATESVCGISGGEHHAGCERCSEQGQIHNCPHWLPPSKKQ
jgi:hypothetical protein